MRVCITCTAIIKMCFDVSIVRGCHCSKSLGAF